MNVVCNWKNCIHPFYNTLIAFDGFSGYDIIIHCEIGILRLLAVYFINSSKSNIFILSIYLFDFIFDKMFLKNSWNNEFRDNVVINFHVPTLAFCRGIKSMRHPVMRQIRVKWFVKMNFRTKTRKIYMFSNYTRIDIWNVTISYLNKI